MEFRRSDKLRSRTFIGLLVAQFLAAFNDQAIHAAAMFFAFHTHLMNEAQAISLMPILFYAPWAIFCTLAGYYADRFSKRNSLVIWKFAEIGICAVAIVGFWLGSHGHAKIGPSIVLGCVFLMGMHSAFFVPAKYGVMPEILEPQILSRGNGVLESLSFLAVILGTVCGGVLSFVFYGHEVWIGVVFFALAVIGALSSLLIEKMPAANPERKFPPFIYGPLWKSLKTLFGSRPLALAAVGIAFFTFVVAYMRQVVYMLGESQTPRWNEMKTSLIVGTTALGIGLGSPLAGWLSGRKIELGLVPLGGIGMVLASLLAAVYVHWVAGLVIAIILIGFFTGFYLVPMYTLLQHRAPKTSKGDAVAVSNFINVTGAILASILFFALVSSFQQLGLAPVIPFVTGPQGQLRKVEFHEGRLIDFAADGISLSRNKSSVLLASPRIPPEVESGDDIWIVVDQAKYQGKDWFRVRLADEPKLPIHDKSDLPRFLFLGAGAITAGILVVLLFVQPDLGYRAAWAARMLAGPRVRAVGTHHVPMAGAVVLATNCKTKADCRHLRSATDRLITFLGPLNGNTNTSIDRIVQQAQGTILRGQVVALTDGALAGVARLHSVAPCVPTSVEGKALSSGRSEVCVSFGPPSAEACNLDTIRTAIRAASEAKDEIEEH